MTEIISYKKDDVSKEAKKLQFDCRINEEVIADLESTEQTQDVIEALKEAYEERKRLDKLTVALLWA